MVLILSIYSFVLTLAVWQESHNELVKKDELQQH